MAPSDYAIDDSMNPRAAHADSTVFASTMAGMWWGLAMWSAFAISEFFFYAVLPLFRTPLALFTPTHWRYNALLFDSYWVLGALSGAAFASLLRTWDHANTVATGRHRDLGRLPATLSLLVAVQVNFCFARPMHPAVVITFAIALALSVAIVWVLRHPGSRFAGIVSNPFLLALLLIVPSWLAGDLEEFGRGTKSLALATVVAAIYGANWFLNRSRPWSAGAHFLSGLALCTVVILACAVRSGAHMLSAPVVPPTVPNAGRPPVVMIIMDTTRADHTSLGGYSRNTTPHLAKFTEGATLFTGAVAAGNFTLPSHASIFTGVYPSFHGAKAVSEFPEMLPLNGELPTLAELLAQKGYATQAVVSNTAFLVPQWGLTRGFQRVGIHVIAGATDPYHSDRLREGIRRLLSMTMPTAEFDRRYRRGQEISSEASGVMARLRDRSFLLFINYMDAHEPYQPPAPFDTLFLGGKPPVSYGRDQNIRAKGGTKATDDERERLTAQYDGGIAYADFAFQQLLDELKREGVYDRAMIIVSSDHGESLGEQGSWGHSTSVDSGQVRIPLVIKYPGQIAPAVVQAPVSHVDLLPTVLDTLGYEIPAHVQGRSLRHPEALGDREILTESLQGIALQRGSTKLIVPPAGKRRMFDVNRDPLEIHDLYSPVNATAAAMDSMFARWQRTVPHQITAGHSSQKNGEELRRLKSLGYVQ